MAGQHRHAGINESDAGLESGPSRLDIRQGRTANEPDDSGLRFCSCSNAREEADLLLGELDRNDIGTTLIPAKPITVTNVTSGFSAAMSYIAPPSSPAGTMISSTPAAARRRYSRLRSVIGGMTSMISTGRSAAACSTPRMSSLLNASSSPLVTTATRVVSLRTVATTRPPTKTASMIDGCHRRPQPPAGATVEPHLPLGTFLVRPYLEFSGLERGTEELQLSSVEVEAARSGPLLVFGEPSPGHQVAGISVGPLPVVDGGDERCMTDKIGARLTNPVTESLPLGQQRLVTYFHRGSTGGPVPIEEQQTSAPESVNDRLEGDDVDVQRDDLLRPDPATRPRVLTRHRHEPQEQLACRFLFFRPQLIEETLGAMGDGAAHATDLVVACLVQDVSGSPIE